MKSHAVGLCLLVMLCTRISCVAQADTIRLVKHTYKVSDDDKRYGPLPYGEIRLTMLDSMTTASLRGAGGPVPETAIGAYKSRYMYGLHLHDKFNIFFVSKKEFNVLFVLVQMINSRAIVVNHPGHTPYIGKYPRKESYFISTRANGTTSHYVLPNKDAAVKYIHKFIAAVRGAELSPATKFGVIDLCKLNLRVMSVKYSKQTK